jgi:hypothetical protein
VHLYEDVLYSPHDLLHRGHIFCHLRWVSRSAVLIPECDPPLERLDVALKGVGDRHPGDSLGLESMDSLYQLGDVDEVSHWKIFDPETLILVGDIYSLKEARLVIPYVEPHSVPP